MTETNDRPSEDVRGEYRPASCRTCSAPIDADERRLSWRVQQSDVIYRFHYCCEACLPERPPEP